MSFEEAVYHAVGFDKKIRVIDWYATNYLYYCKETKKLKVSNSLPFSYEGYSDDCESGEWEFYNEKFQKSYKMAECKN